MLQCTHADHRRGRSVSTGEIICKIKRLTGFTNPRQQWHNCCSSMLTTIGPIGCMPCKKRTLSLAMLCCLISAKIAAYVSLGNSATVLVCCQTNTQQTRTCPLRATCCFRVLQRKTAHHSRFVAFAGCFLSVAAFQPPLGPTFVFPPSGSCL